MAVRSPRRSFAAPFVITIGPLASLAGCVAEAPPRRHEPVATVTPGDDGPPPTSPAAPPNTRPVENPPPPRPPIEQVTPRPEQQAPVAPTGERHWTVSMYNGKCSTHGAFHCPKGEPGHPMPTCNPPPPRPYMCLAGMQDGASLEIVQYAGATQCYIPPPRVDCPKGAMCNPPPPREVPCP